MLVGDNLLVEGTTPHHPLRRELLLKEKPRRAPFLSLPLEGKVDSPSGEDG